MSPVQEVIKIVLTVVSATILTCLAVWLKDRQARVIAVVGQLVSLSLLVFLLFNISPEAQQILKPFWDWLEVEVTGVVTIYLAILWFKTKQRNLGLATACSFIAFLMFLI